MINKETEKFKELVEKALLMLPEQIRVMMNNVAVCVEDYPSTEQIKNFKVGGRNNLLGLYEGIPQNTWGKGKGNNLPDKITIFRIPIERTSSDPKEIEKIVRDVVWHEVAHHFGFEEEEIFKLEKGWKKRKIDLK